MTDRLLEELARGVGVVRADAPLGPLTTLRVGGCARVMVIVDDLNELGHTARVAAAHDLPCLMLGRGSNILVPDIGWPGIAIQLGRGFRGWRHLGEGRVKVGGAEPLPALAAALADEGIDGFAWASAVPGTIGGAVRMNAGAHGGTMADVVVQVELLSLADGSVTNVAAESLQFGYRRSSVDASQVVTGATLALSPGEPEQLRKDIAEIRAWRREHQPLNRPNCGSVFANPPSASAGALIERAGAKGMRRGGAQVSTMHANFIVTRPGATAADVRALISDVQARVEAATGVRLVPEVVIVEPPSSS